MTVNKGRPKNTTLSKEFLEKEILTKTVKQIALENPNISERIIYRRIKEFEIEIPKRYENLIGQKTPNGIVIERIGSRPELKRSTIYWKIQCNCGNTHLITTKDVKNGITKSCGCLTNKILKLIRYKGYKDITGTHFSKIKKGAELRKLEFNITIEDIWNLFEKQNRKCSLSGIDLFFGNEYRRENGTASLDRIDSKLGYTIDNVQWIHKDINLMKQNLNQDKFIQWCKLISINIGDK